MARKGSKVQKVTPPALKRRETAGSSTASSQASRTTARSTGSSKAAASQASSHALKASSSAARRARSASSVAAKTTASKARKRSLHRTGGRDDVESRHQASTTPSKSASVPARPADRPATSA